MGDFSAHFHRPESGIHTVEGNVAGARAASLSKKRRQQQEEFEQRKQQIVESEKKKAKSIHDKFAGDSTLSKAEQTFRSQTIGLVSAEDFKKAARAKEKQQQPGDHDDDDDNNELVAQELKLQEKKKKKQSKKAKKKKRQAMSTLSFAHEDETLDDQDDPNDTTSNNKLVFKDPTTDTSFLPDKEREISLLRERQELQKQWKDQQVAIRNEKLEITYSYWDGSGHRRKVLVQKGDSIASFLESVRKDLCSEFKELQATSSDALLYVKEDLILPQDMTFYDLIVTKARGKSGPLFHFDVHDDVRVGPVDSRVEKDESHPGKVVERKWYDRNKHIFPASRWEIYDPLKNYGTYTIHGKEVKGKK